MLKLFNSHAVLNSFFGPFIYKTAKKVLNGDGGQVLAFKILKDCLSQYYQVESVKKHPHTAKQQPMYLIQKGNYNYNRSEED